MPLPDQNSLINQYVTETNRRIGEITVPKLGEYPPDLDNYYGSLMNEMATSDLIRHYADAVGDRNPMWRSQEYCRGTIWGGMIAQPTFTDSILHPYPVKFEPEQIKKFNGFYQLPNGSRRQLFHVIRPGDTFHAIDRFLGLAEVEPTRPGARQFDRVIQRTLMNQREETVAILDMHREVVVNYVPDKNHPYYPIRRKVKLTDQERDAILDGYDTESRRGAKTLYWEDVVIGEEFKLHDIGPLSVWDTAAFLVAISGHAVAFEIQWERLKLYLGFAWLDPEVNAWKCTAECHLVDGAAHAGKMTGGTALGFYPQIEALAARTLTNWMGDSGFLKLLDCRFPVLPNLGEVLRFRGAVTGKSISGGEHLVDTDIRCENQDGLVIMKGTSQVRLQARVNSTDGLP